MRTLYAFILTALIAACNNSAKKTDDIKDTTNQVKQMPATQGAPDTIFTGFGTEPFWAVYVISNDKIVFHPADGPDKEVPFANATTPENGTTKYSSSSGSTAIDLTIIKKNCSDGMSDQVHLYEVKLTVDTTKYSGCGRNH